MFTFGRSGVIGNKSETVLLTYSTSKNIIILIIFKYPNHYLYMDVEAYRQLLCAYIVSPSSTMRPFECWFLTQHQFDPLQRCSNISKDRLNACQEFPVPVWGWKHASFSYWRLLNSVWISPSAGFLSRWAAMTAWRPRSHTHSAPRGPETSGMRPSEISVTATTVLKQFLENLSLATFVNVSENK